MGKHRQIFLQKKTQAESGAKEKRRRFLIFCVVLVRCNSTYHGRNHGNHYCKDDN